MCVDVVVVVEVLKVVVCRGVGWMGEVGWVVLEKPTRKSLKSDLISHDGTEAFLAHNSLHSFKETHPTSTHVRTSYRLGFSLYQHEESHAKRLTDIATFQERTQFLLVFVQKPLIWATICRLRRAFVLIV